MQLTSDQENALRAFETWYKQKYYKRFPWFRLEGYAGTGKTTIAKQMASIVGSKIIYMAYTGMASQVMQRNGMAGASTIHSACYVFRAPKKEDFDRINRRLSAATDPKEIEKLQEQLADTQRKRFRFDPEGPASRADLIVLDEVSMVGAEMFNDLLSYGVPILAIGDPGQLPPIGDTCPIFESRPPEASAMLREITRQAAESPIIRASILAREGKPLLYEDWGEYRKIPKKDASRDDFMEVDQIICGMNKTRLGINTRYRSHAGLDNFDDLGVPLPMKNERLICLRNNREKGIVNGTQCKVLSADTSFRPDLEMELRIIGGHKLNVKAISAHFEEYVMPGTYKALSFWDKKRAEEFDFAYCITVHKFQGSQAPSVTLVDDGFGRWDYGMRSRFLYTAITRAENKLTIVG